MSNLHRLVNNTTVAPVLRLFSSQYSVECSVQSRVYWEVEQTSVVVAQRWKTSANTDVKLLVTCLSFRPESRGYVERGLF